MRHKRSLNMVLVSMTVMAMVALGLGGGAGALAPGAPPHPAVDPPGSLSPFTTVTGKVSLSVDAFGSNDPAGGTINVHKNAGATVKAAFLLAASTGFSGYTPVNGDITLNGTAVTLDPTHTIPNQIGSINVFSDVTSLVKPIVDPAGAGNVPFTVAEPNNPTLIDGEVLAVILNDPTQVVDNTISLLYGAQATTGDNFSIGLAKPIDKTDPNLALNMSLGISFGFQPSGQFSQIDVNGQRLTTSAGGQDDCVEKQNPTPDFNNCGNGELITAGGIGDSTANPPDPNATDQTCGPPAAPRCDDELYNLLPFVNNGDTSINVDTLNPSNDDNIFFGAFQLNSTAAVVGEGAVLSPVSATNPVGSNHTVTAKVQDVDGNAIVGRTVTFKVISGPNTGKTGTAVTDATGSASFTYSDTGGAGTDTIQASFVDDAGKTIVSNQASKTWMNGDKTPPSCSLLGVINGPPKAIQITTSDSGGLASIVVTKSTNATTPVPAFTVGTTSPVVVTSTKVNQSASSTVALKVTDTAGNVTNCDPTLTTLTGPHDSARLTNASGNEPLVTVRNGKPGLKHVTVVVNGHRYDVSVGSGSTKTINIGSALKAGDGNTIKLSGSGNGSADVLVWDGNH
jgi:hypothetical protein